MNIPFNKPYYGLNAEHYLAKALEIGGLTGNQNYLLSCEQKINELVGSHRALLTSSCTSALELSALLINIQPGDEVIMPSFTFSSTANAFMLRGANIKFVDICLDTLNIDINALKKSVSLNTKCIVPVHYAGIACDIETIVDIAEHYRCVVVEDAAQALGSRGKDKYCGAYGDLSTFSFHETKNVTSGEGGALVINNPALEERAEILRSKGTNRSAFLKGQVDKYTWVDIGSSFAPSELNAALLYSQLEEIDKINAKRIALCERYLENLSSASGSDTFSMSRSHAELGGNGHIFYIRLNNEETRNNLIKFLQKNGIDATFHFIPLHSSPMGTKSGGGRFSLPNTDKASETILRLPLFYELSCEEVDFICQVICDFFN